MLAYRETRPVPSFETLTLLPTEIPEPPTKVKPPEHFKIYESFKNVLERVKQSIEADPEKRKKLSDFIQCTLYSRAPNVLASSSPPKELMRHVRLHCSPLNTQLLNMISDCLTDDEFKRLLQEHERILSGQLQQTKWDTEIDVAPPSTYKIMLVKMKKQDSTTVREAVEVRDCLAEYLKPKDSKTTKINILYLAGIANDTLVLYLPEGSPEKLLLAVYDDTDMVLALQVEEITYVGHVRLEVARKDFTLHPEVCIQTMHN